MPNESFDASNYCYPAGEFQFGIFAFAERSLLQVANRRSKSFGMAIFAVPFELFVIVGQRRFSGRTQINRLAGSIHQHFGKDAGNLEARRIFGGRRPFAFDRLVQSFEPL